MALPFYYYLNELYLYVMYLMPFKSKSSKSKLFNRNKFDIKKLPIPILIIIY